MLHTLSTVMPLVKQKSPRLLVLSTEPAILHRWPITAIAWVSGGYWDERNMLGHWDTTDQPEAGGEKKKQVGFSVAPAGMPLKPGQLVYLDNQSSCCHCQSVGEGQVIIRATWVEVGRMGL